MPKMIDLRINVTRHADGSLCMPSSQARLLGDADEELPDWLLFGSVKGIIVISIEDVIRYHTEDPRGDKDFADALRQCIPDAERLLTKMTTSRRVLRGRLIVPHPFGNSAKPGQS